MSDLGFMLVHGGAHDARCRERQMHLAEAECPRQPCRDQLRPNGKSAGSGTRATGTQVARQLDSPLLPVFIPGGPYTRSASITQR